MPPFLWLLHMYPFAKRVREAFVARVGKDTVKNPRLLPYAGDIMCALAHSDLEELTEMVWILADICQHELSILGLSPGQGKSEGFLFPPNFGGESLFHRHPRNSPAGGQTPCTRAQPQAAEYPKRCQAQAKQLEHSEPKTESPTQTFKQERAGPKVRMVKSKWKSKAEYLYIKWQEPRNSERTNSQGNHGYCLLIRS